MTTVGFLTALLGGMLALLSPCSAMLLPAFFAYAFQRPAQLAGRTLLFYAGLCLTLVPLGVGSAAVNGLFYAHRQLLITVAGLLIVALGVLQALGGGFVLRPVQRLAGRIRGAGAASVFALGAVYGLAGFCSGPILGSVLSVAMADGEPVRGGALLATYALGMVAPLFVLALLWDRLDLGRRRVLRGRTVRLGRLRLHSTSLLSGLLFVGVGVLFLVFDGTAGIAGVVDVDTEYRLQQEVVRLAGRVPDVLVPLAIGLAAVAVLVIGWLRRRARGGLAGPHDPPGAGRPTDIAADRPVDRDRPSNRTRPDGHGHAGGPGTAKAVAARYQREESHPCDAEPS